jgi:hypothetical protein
LRPPPNAIANVEFIMVSDSGFEPVRDDTFIRGEELLERAKQVARKIDERFRKLIGRARQDTPTTDNDASPPAAETSAQDQ